MLTGRSFGVTNLIIIDSDGNPIVDETVVVQGHEANTVRIYRRAVRETLACSPICEPTLTIGDDADTFTSANEQIKSRNLLSDQTAANRKHSEQKKEHDKVGGELEELLRRLARVKDQIT